MRRISYILALLTFLFSCAGRADTPINCAYTFTQLQDTFDTSRYSSRITNILWTEATDKDNSFGEKGLYQFDQKLRLRKYAFLLDNTYDAYYIVEYDSLGKEIQHPKSEVVRWYLRDEGVDSITLAFYLNMIQHRYYDVQLRYGDTLISIPKIEDSERFTNLGVAHLKLGKLHEGQKVVIKGIKTNTCSYQLRKFSDSLIIPKEYSRSAANSSLLQ